MKISEKCKVIAAGTIVAALMARAGRQPRRGRSFCGACAAE